MYDLLRSQLKKGETLNAYLFYGEEQYLMKHYLNTLLKKLGIEENGFNILRVNGKNLDADALNEYLENYPLMNDKKAAVITDLPWSEKEFCRELAPLIAGLADYAVVIIYQQTVKTDASTAYSRELVNAINGRGICVNFKKAGEAELVPWVARHAKSMHKSISTELCKYIIRLCGGDMLLLGNEIQKLCCYAATDQITKQQIDTIMTKSVDIGAFDLSNAIIDRRTDAAYKALDGLFAKADKPELIAGGIFSAFIRLYKVKCAIERGIQQSEIASEMGVSGAAVFSITRLSGKCSSSYLEKALILCGELDSGVKLGISDKKILFQKFIAKMSLIA